MVFGLADAVANQLGFAEYSVTARADHPVPHNRHRSGCVCHSAENGQRLQRMKKFQEEHFEEVKAHGETANK